MAGSQTAAVTQRGAKINLCPTLQQLEGEWKYSNGTEEIKIYLRFVQSFSNATDFGINHNSVDDRLLGWINYSVNGTVIESNYSNRFMTISENWYLLRTMSSFSLFLSNDIHGYPSYACGAGHLSGVIVDHGHSDQLKLVNAFLINNNTQMDWTQKHVTGYGAFNGDYGMTLPEHFVLTKQ